MSNAPKQDLRTWLAQMDAAGELQTVKGAEREEEIGCIVDFYQRQTGNKAVLFDEIPGYPSGYRVVANILTSVRRIKLTLGLPPDASDMELDRLLAPLHEGGQDHPARYGADRAADGERQPRRRDRICSRSRRRNGTSTTADITSAPAAW